MVQLIEDNEKKVYPKEPLDKSLILNSIKSFQPDGVIMGTEKMTQPKKNNFGKVTMSGIFTIIGEMPKCRMYVLDDDGQYIMFEDEMTGEERRKVKIDDGQLKTVFFPFYANLGKDEDGLDENTTLIITPGTSSYSFFREAFIDAGELPSNAPRQAIATNYAEIKEVVTGFTFRAKYEVIKGKNRSFPSLLCERIEDE